MSAEMPVRKKATRFRLYAPYALLALLAVGWSIAWFVIRGRVEHGLDQWLAAEAAQGRRWTCVDRRVGGYPFRIELTCSGVTLDRPDVTASTGRLLVVAQVYAPNHVIAEAAGPLRVEAGGTTAQASWSLLQSSIVSERGRVARVAVVADGPRIQVTPSNGEPVELTGRKLELHLRPDPRADGSFDGAVSAAGTVVPGLDALVGGTEPADLELVAAISRAAEFPARAVPAELERWRLAGGRLDLTRLSLVKGPRRVEVKGQLGLDDQHRIDGQVDVATAGLEGLVGRIAGDRSVLGGRLLGSLLGSPPPAIDQKPAGVPGAPAPRPLPTIRLQDGRAFFGPLPIPNFRLTPLY
ncbi:MAG: DUF2125 domain-containing protein [Methylobacteriaceae bacterium]|nr:DUF2125 domain-containing protein [Methylobacteriaceae bacterium]